MSFSRDARRPVIPLTRHESSLLHPEDGGEGSREKDALHGRKSHHSLGVRRVVSVDPGQRPVGLLFDGCQERGNGKKR